MNRVQLLNRLGRAWDELLASYSGLSEQRMLRPGVAGAWSVRDIIAHVTSWEEESLNHAPTILAGRRPPRYSVTHGGIDAFNAQTTAQRSSLALAEVLRQRDETHRRLIDFLQEVPEEQFTRETRFRRRLRFDTYAHYRKHAEAIRRWRNER